MKRLLAVVLCGVLLTGCAELQIDAGLDQSHVAYLTYELRLDAAQMEKEERAAAVRAVRELEAYFSSQEDGFSVERIEAPDLIRLVLYMVRPCASREEGLLTLKEMLEDPRFTPFSEVSLKREVSQFEEALFLSGKLVPLDIFEAMSLHTLPASTRAEFAEAVKESKGELTVELPGTEASLHSHPIRADQGTITLSVPLTVEENTELTLVTRISTGGQTGVSAREEGKKLERRSTVYLLLTLLFLGWILFVMVRMKSKKPSDPSERHL